MMSTKLTILVMAVLGLAGLATAGAPHAISHEQAVAAALNDVVESECGVEVRNRDHVASFDACGVTFLPTRGGPAWHWRPAATTAEVDPRWDAASRHVVYDRGDLVERYVVKARSVEQQFVVPGPPSRGSGIVVDGVIDCAGRFGHHPQGWTWRTDAGVVSLGRVRVFDADGRDIAASMTATATGTAIVVEAEALAGVSYPVTIDPEIGTNDFRLSDMGPDGDIDFDALTPQVAYNATQNEYLVVWSGDDDRAGLGDGQAEIFGQRIDAGTGAAVGTPDFRISDMGDDGDATFDAGRPAVAWNAIDNEYLVVWEGDDDVGGLIDGEQEIFGQILDGVTGAELGANDFRISDTGPDLDVLHMASRPRVVHASGTNEYLVVWHGDELDEQYEIYGQMLSASGVEVGANDFRISAMGPEGDVLYEGRRASVAYNATAGEFLVVWQGDHDDVAEDELEIYGQRLDAFGGEIGADDFRISDLGPDGDSTFDAERPDVAWNPASNEYLVVWEGDDDTGDQVNGESEIFAQRLDAAGGEIGLNDIRISEMSGLGDPLYDAERPCVTYDHVHDEYLVVWESDTGDLIDEELEIWGQRLDALGGEVGDDDFRLSDMGVDGDHAADASAAAVAFSGPNASFLVVWQGDDATLPLVDDEREIWGQLVDAVGGGEIGVNDFRISVMGVDGDINFDARAVAVAYSSVEHEYLVVWEGDDDSLGDGETEIFGQRIDAETGLEIGANDFRISDAGPDGDPLFDADGPAVAYNAKANEYLVVWTADEVVDGDEEIRGQRLDAATGAEVGTNDFRISDMGPDGDPLYNARSPDVAYNSVNDEYLVVWRGDDDSLVAGELEIWGQRLSGDGLEIGVNDFRISDAGPDGVSMFDAEAPAVAYNSVDNEYLVVWQADDDAGGLAEGEIEIWGQRLSASGAAIGVNDFRISDMGPDGVTSFDAERPDVAYNPTANEYLVVWEGDDDTGDLVNGEQEIFGQRLAGSTEAPVGANDFRISDMGPDGSSIYDAQAPSVTYVAAVDEYFVAWQADDDAGGISNGETEIFVQRLDGDGLPAGDNDVRISDMGVDGNDSSDALEPAMAAATGIDEALVVWQGDDATGPLRDDEFEVYGQLFASEATPCPGDSTGDGVVDVQDLIAVIVNWGTADPVVDGNGDGIVDVLDLVDVIVNWGPCP